MNVQHERIAGLCTQLKLDCVARDRGSLAQHAATRDASLADSLGSVHILTSGPKAQASEAKAK
ncbi:hypothetical protein WS70_11495 [Burkholderia mayonis]|uniref:Uncharacterized protein n=1 Tax=Burkholderia mayonis TaxID=1385591 RepID=A0A1B4FF94_9BURK|nr:hypothetical protein WS70_11495 [Burkholderia mayonis]